MQRWGMILITLQQSEFLLAYALLSTCLVACHFSRMQPTTGSIQDLWQE